MQEKLEDQISAFLDEELPDEECQLLVRRLTRDDQLRATFGRYALVGAILRREPGIRPQPELVTRVSDAIAGEEAHELSPTAARLSQKWLRPVAGGAIAATVAVLALLSLRPTPVDERALVDTNEPLEAAVIVPLPAERRPVARPRRASPTISSATAITREVSTSSRTSSSTMATTRLRWISRTNEISHQPALRLRSSSAAEPGGPWSG